MTTEHGELGAVEGGYRAIFERSPDAVLVQDAETTAILDANEAAVDLFGMSREALLEADVDAISPAGQTFTRERAVELMQQAVSEGEVIGEWQIEQPGGGRFWVEVTLRPATIDGTERVLAFVTDITEHKERERRLQENDAILRQLTETADDVFWLFNSDFTEVRFVNDAYEDVWGRSLADLQEDPMDFMEGVHPQDREIVAGAVERLGNGESTDVEYRVNPGEDFQRWVSVRGEPIYEDGEVVRATGYARDITERKEREQQLKALNEATKRLSYAKTHDDVAQKIIDIVTDTLGQPRTALWKYDAEQDLLVPWVASEPAQSLADDGGIEPISPGTFEMETFRGGEPKRANDYQSVDTPSSPETPVGSLLLVPLGEFGLLNVGTAATDQFDATEQNLLSILASNAEAAFQRAEREQALETYKDKLEESNENLQEFAYIASHDLQEPLRSVTSYLDLLATEYDDILDEEGQFYIDRAESNASRMSAMIDALLQYSRVGTDGSEFDEVDADKAVTQTLDSLGVLISESDASTSTDSLPTVTADEDQLGQLFQNLIKNAIEHGGDPPEIEIAVAEGDDAWEFSVSDNGPGIPEEQHDRIFEIFQQATTDDDSGEAGIGLAICERIIARHRGDIWVESGEVGSTFKFTLPKRRVEEQADHGAQ